MEMMVKPHEITDAKDATVLAPVTGEIRFDHATFHYGKSKGVIERT